MAVGQIPKTDQWKQSGNHKLQLLGYVPCSSDRCIFLRTDRSPNSPAEKNNRSETKDDFGQLMEKTCA